MANPEQSRQLAAQNLNPDEILKADADSPMDSSSLEEAGGIGCLDTAVAAGNYHIVSQWRP